MWRIYFIIYIKMSTRKAYVAGRFYEGTKNALEKQINDVFEKEKSNIKFSLASKNIVGGIVPHAGYMFSAYQALHYFKIIAESIKNPDVFIIINPNHSGFGPVIALDENESWETPFGKVEIDMEFNDALGFEKDSSAHNYEHSGEVMLPFLQHFIKHPFKIVPVSLTKQTPEAAELLAKAIFNANKKLHRNLNIIASSDFSHYVSPEKGKQQDNFAVEQILNLNPVGLYKAIKDKGISACGYGPIMALIYYTKLAAKNPKMEILKRGHSGEIMPSDEVVHYISFLACDDD